MTNDTDRKSAYAAGRAAFSSEPPERRTVAGCPFPVGDELRGEWLRGFDDAMNEGQDLTSLRRELAAAREEAGA